jgi:hypothetical protein
LIWPLKGNCGSTLSINQKYFYFLRDAMVFTLRIKIHNTCSTSMFCSADIVERRGMFTTWQSKWPWLETTFSFLRSLLSLLSSLSVFLAIFSLSFLRSLIPCYPLSLNKFPLLDQLTSLFYKFFLFLINVHI